MKMELCANSWVKSFINGMSRHTPSGEAMLGGALTFSNSITIEENTLGPGVVGHLLHARTISPTTFAATDRWFAYDQVGSVIAETDADGELAATHHADAWGNRLEDWDTGVWGGLRVGWAHNTKEIDGLTDLTYMYQRWYAPETGTFLSRAPYPPMMEHEYGFAAENPVSLVDPRGEQYSEGYFMPEMWHASFAPPSETPPPSQPKNEDCSSPSLPPLPEWHDQWAESNWGYPPIPSDLPDDFLAPKPPSIFGPEDDWITPEGWDQTLENALLAGNAIAVGGGVALAGGNLAGGVVMAVGAGVVIASTVGIWVDGYIAP